MGTSESKIGQIPEEKPTEGSLPSTPILTTKNPQNQNEPIILDPRSPSANIARTPIEVSRIETESSEEIILGFDPRSPTSDFVRTPIVIQNKESKLPKKILNKNLEKVKNLSIITSPKKTEAKVIPPKLLSSSPLTPKPEAYKRKSFVGLLQTNIDYTETDLDVVLREKSKIKSIEPVSPNPLEAVQDENIDPRSPSVDFTRTPVTIIKKVEEIGINEENVYEEIESEPIEDEPDETETVKPDPEPNPEVQIEETPKTEKQEQEPQSSETVPVCVTPSRPISLKETEEKMITPLMNLTQNVQEFDKKLTKLIFHDEDIVQNPTVVKLKENSRTPLGVRDTNSEPRKAIARLKVSDKPRRSDYAVSKIPVFKEKTKKGLCENTPPNLINKRHLNKKSQWDNDNTLII